MKGFDYRPEIDGLRAIAVLAVVLYHAGFGPDAGFVGVDVFFVISGYLITGLLFKEWTETGSLDLTAFYARRVRRLFPALAVVVVVTLAASAAIPAMQRELTQLFDSAAAALVFASNFYFQSFTGGYFDADSKSMPLLHLWSLAVEEQFYLVWPLGLMALLTLPRKAVAAALIVLTLVSFALAEWWAFNDSELAFYQMPARFWELAIGGLIAVRRTNAVHRGVAFAGVMLVLAAAAVPIGHFPGLGAVPAVAGAAMILLAIHGQGELGWSGAWLRSRPMVFVGLISYSLYLWHWPLFVLEREARIGTSPAWVRAGLCVFAILLASFTWRFVERPFRRVAGPDRRLVAAAVTASLSLAVCALTLGNSLRQPATQQIANTPGARASNDQPTDFIERCSYGPMESLEVFPKPGCAASRATKVVMWGDSMASSWQPMAVAMDKHSATYTRAGCPPAIGYSVMFRAKLIRDLCLGFNPKVASSIGHVDTLILSARWEQYPDLDPALSATLAQMGSSATRIILLGVTPTMRDTAMRCIELGKIDDCAITRAEFEAHKEPIRQRLVAIAKKYPNVEYLDPTDFFCTPDSCPLMKDGYSLYSDADHISSSAARGFANAFQRDAGLFSAPVVSLGQR